MNGGDTSMYPCSFVWTSSMNWISARSRRAPAPTKTGKLDPTSLPDAWKFRMPSASPISQCGTGLSDREWGSPHSRTGTFSSSSAPTGTDSCGMLGIMSASASISSRIAASFSSYSLMLAATSRIRAMGSDASSPAFLSVAMRSLSTFL